MNTEWLHELKSGSTQFFILPSKFKEPSKRCCIVLRPARVYILWLRAWKDKRHTQAQYKMSNALRVYDDDDYDEIVRFVWDPKIHIIRRTTHRNPIASSRKVLGFYFHKHTFPIRCIIYDFIHLYWSNFFAIFILFSSLRTHCLLWQSLLYQGSLKWVKSNLSLKLSADSIFSTASLP